MIVPQENAKHNLRFRGKISTEKKQKQNPNKEKKMPLAQFLTANRLRSLPWENVTFTLIESSNNRGFKILTRYFKLRFQPPQRIGRRGVGLERSVLTGV